MTTVVSRTILLTFVAGLALLGAGPARAATIPVTCSESDLRAKMIAAANGDTLVIPDGCVIKITSNSNESDNVDGDFDFTSSSNPTTTEITIQGSGPGRSIIDGNGTDRVFDLGSGQTLHLVGLTVRNGDATVSTNGSDNAAGGIRVSGTLTADNVVFLNNTATVGGGVYDNDGAITLTNVALIGNTATTGDGGGAYFFLTPDTLTNVTVSGNSAPAGTGGGIFQQDGPLALTNVTIANNTADTGGGLTTAGATTMTNTLIGGNAGTTSDPDCENNLSGGTITSNGHNLVQVKSTNCTFTNATGDLVNTDPKIAPLANNGGFTLTHALLPGSPAIDAGDAAACPATDQRGVPRPLDGDASGSAACDIGAFELAPSTLAISLNDISYDAGDTLTVGAVLFNAGAAVTVDAYLGFFLADGMIPGCAAVPLAFVNSSGGLVLLCGATTPAGDFPKFVAGVTIPTMATPSVLPGVFSATIPVAPLGVIEAFGALTPAGALDDDAIGPTDVLAFSLVEFAVPAP